MKWSEDKKVLEKQVNQAFDELGFEFPENEEQLRFYDEKFEGYPYKLTGNELDPAKIWQEATSDDRRKSK